MPSLVQQFVRWLTRNRVRVSPREGAVLRLTPGDVVRIRDVAYRVTRRTVVSSRPAVTYDCVSASSSASLTVDAEPLRIVFGDGQRTIELPPEDVETFLQTDHG